MQPISCYTLDTLHMIMFILGDTLGNHRFASHSVLRTPNFGLTAFFKRYLA
jgi:hypothetical protein